MRKARELPSNIAHLPAYRPPAPGRVRHDEVWVRAHARWQPGMTVTVRFPPERRR